ncbi:MAG TPA: hypothetical protein VK745_19255 [Polyangiaceae bacterium]|jgi:hypothetical protein|nr:hypothetical protein [Polyangiaceae bacterium]
MAAHEIDQLLAALRGLAPAKRRELLELAAEELPDEVVDPFALIGSFADEPELVDAICEDAMHTREHSQLRVP